MTNEPDEVAAAIAEFVYQSHEGRVWWTNEKTAALQRIATAAEHKGRIEALREMDLAAWHPKDGRDKLAEEEAK